MNYPKLKGVRILVVDDEPLVLDTIKEHLELEGVVVNTAISGNEALKMLADKTYNLILSDIRMPNGSGTELLKNVLSSSHQAPPLILMSSFGDITDKKARALGARGMFLKPDSMENLKELLAESLN